MTRLLLTLAIAPVFVATAGGQTAEPALHKDASVRVWSVTKRLVARKGFIQWRSNDTISVRISRPAHTEFDDLWETVVLTPADVDTIDVFLDGNWMRADFSMAPPRPVPVASGQPRVTTLKPESKLRIWAPLLGLEGKRGVLLAQDGSALFVRVDRPLPDEWDARERSIPTQMLDSLEIRGGGLGVRRGAYHGLVIGSLLAAGIDMASQTCDEKCGHFPPNIVQVTLVGGASGALLGALVGAFFNQHWLPVKLH